MSDENRNEVTESENMVMARKGECFRVEVDDDGDLLFCIPYKSLMDIINWRGLSVKMKFSIGDEILYRISDTEICRCRVIDAMEGARFSAYLLQVSSSQRNWFDSELIDKNSIRFVDKEAKADEEQAAS